MKEIKMPFEEYEKMQKEIQDLRKEVNLHRGNVPRLIIENKSYRFNPPEAVALTEAQSVYQEIVEKNIIILKELEFKKREVNFLKRKLENFNILTLWERINYKPQYYTYRDFL